LKLSTLFIIGTFAVFLLIGVYGYYTFSLSIQEVNKLLAARNEGFAFNMMQDLDEYIDKRIGDFKRLTKLPSIQDSLKLSNLKSSKINNIENTGDKLNSFNDEDNQQFLSDSKVRVTSELRDVVKFYKSEYDYDVISELYVTNAYGANISIDSGVLDYRYDDQTWWQETKTQGVHIEYDDEKNNNIVLGLRIDDENGNFLGILRISLTLKDLIHEFVNDAEILELQNRAIVLINDKGKVLYSKDINNFEESQTLPYFDQIVFMNNVGTIDTTKDNVEDSKLISYAKSTGYKEFVGLGWIVIVDQANSSITEEFVDLKNSYLVLSILGMIFSVMIGLAFAYVVSNPLRSLSNMAKQFSVGDFNSKFRGSKISEINMIGKSFDLMGDSLKKLIETEKKLAESHVMVKNERMSAIGELSASMAHDLKNPLATIKTSATIIQKQTKGKDPEIEKAIQRMNRAIFRISHQIDDVLNFVRIPILKTSETKLSKIISNSIDLLEIPDNIKLETHDLDVTVNCDSKKMEIVFINIILNAIQAIGESKGSIIIKSEITDYEVKVIISDSGPEIPQEILEKIFEPLFTTKEKGTGLGLSSCKNIVEQHGGAISAHSNPTTFTVTLPKIE